MIVIVASCVVKEPHFEDVGLHVTLMVACCAVIERHLADLGYK